MFIERDGNRYELTRNELYQAYRELEQEYHLEDIQAFFRDKGVNIDRKAAEMLLNEYEDAYEAVTDYEVNEGLVNDLFEERLDSAKKGLEQTKESTENLYPENDDGFEAAIDNAIKAIDALQKDEKGKDIEL